jgi:predicted amidohydrolase
MATIVLLQALPALRGASRENLARAQKLPEGSQGQEADLTCFPEYFPRLGEDEAVTAAARLRR